MFRSITVNYIHTNWKFFSLRLFFGSLATEMGLRRPRNDTLFYFLFVCLLFGLMLITFNVYELSSIKNTENAKGQITPRDNQRYLAWIYADHVRRMFAFILEFIVVFVLKML